jgi:GNAT superfamily N-acetyltransferase
MEIRQLTIEEIKKYRHNLIRFIRKFSDGRITLRAIRWFKQLNLENVSPGTLVVVSLEGKKLTGVIIICHYGLEESLIAVHHSYRKQGVGITLLNHTLQHLEKVYTRVACDNIPSLKVCFACGLCAFHLIKGPTGKPTLWLGGGNWSPQDIESYK